MKDVRSQGMLVKLLHLGFAAGDAGFYLSVAFVSKAVVCNNPIRYCRLYTPRPKKAVPTQGLQKSHSAEATRRVPTLEEAEVWDPNFNYSKPLFLEGSL